MNKEKNKKCEKCGQGMINGEPFLHIKEEGQKARKDSENAYYCANKECESWNIIITFA
ncbi:MAG: hypothetical protein Q8N55_02875 [bacterium]|nr:hypothetical protein [bacterium]